MSFGARDTQATLLPGGSAPEGPRLPTPVYRRYRLLASCVLLLAAFNLTYRVGLESVEEWDESLYATTAWEMLQSGHPIATTFDGELDYYNSKPPLNVWLVAAAFAAFGVNLIALRVASAASAWLTVLALQLWTRRVFGDTVSLLASLVLATSFGFLHLHSGRSGNPDALMALLVLLTVITLWAGLERPWRRAWLGPILAGVFLLKGMAVLMPLAIVVVVEAAGRRPRQRWAPLAAAALLFLAPAGAWAAARWRLDGWRFFDRMFNQDFVALASGAVEDRTGGALFYLDVLQKYQYDWLLAGVGAALLARRHWGAMSRALRVSLRERHAPVMLLGAWAAVTLAVPTLVQTKLFWYLNPFYPCFAVLVGLALAAAGTGATGPGLRQRTLAAWLVAMAVASSEARSLWRVHRVTNLRTSVQGLLLSKRHDFRGTRICRDRLHRGEAFVVKAMMGTTFHVMTGGDRGDTPRPGDLYVFSQEIQDDRLRPIGQADGNFVYEAP